MTSEKLPPPEIEAVEDEEPFRLPKIPVRSSFPSKCPPACNRECKRFYETHTRLLSFALYATQDPAKDPRRICVYAFSCGMEIESMPFILKEGETPQELVVRVVPELMKLFIEMAEFSLKEGATKQ